MGDPAWSLPKQVCGPGRKAVGGQRRLIKKDLTQPLLGSGAGDPRSCCLPLTPEEAGTMAITWSHLPLPACEFLAAE